MMIVIIQVRCKIQEHCDDYGAYVVVTNYGEGDRTDFIMSPCASSRLAHKLLWSPSNTMSLMLNSEGSPVDTLDTMSSSKSMSIVKKPNYLGIVILYAAGQYNITAVQFWQVCNTQALLPSIHNLHLYIEHI